MCLICGKFRRIVKQKEPFVSGAGPGVTFLSCHFRRLLGTPGMRRSPVNSQHVPIARNEQPSARQSDRELHWIFAAWRWYRPSCRWLGHRFFESEGSAPGKGVRYFVEVFVDGTIAVSA